MKQYPCIPAQHLEFINSSVEKLKADQRILGVAVAGSFVLKTMDEFSDLDLVIFVDPVHYDQVIKERKKVAQDIGILLESFSGEHVGEPRLLVCLYGPPLLHVDLKFISLNDMGQRVEDPQILWQRDHVISDNLSRSQAYFPGPDLAWIENRFWIWIHYIAQKIIRGELFETIDALNFIRSHVLGPMLLQHAGARPQGVRRIEKYITNDLEKLKRTIPSYDKTNCIASLKESIDLYCKLRITLNHNNDYSHPSKVQTEVLKYLSEIEHGTETE